MDSLNSQIQLAIEGDKEALTRVLGEVKQDVFNLALRMLVDHQKAEDASQDILIKIMTNLGSFQFNSHFRTWVYRIAANYLISSKRAKDYELTLEFNDFKADLESDLQPSSDLASHAEYPIMLNELRISCTMAMLLCLKPTPRLTYILGEILELDHQEGSKILGVSTAGYRKQLQRARQLIEDFTSKSCGLISEQALCHCTKKLVGSCSRGCVSEENIRFATEQQIDFTLVESALSETNTRLRTVFSQRSIQTYFTPESLTATLSEVVAQAKYRYGHA